VKWGIVTFPGSNDDADTLHALRDVLGEDVCCLWHKDTGLQGVDCVVLPGGFSYGDYLRCGAMAKFSPIMRTVQEFAGGGGLVLGICNGFQILCEAGLLPGALVRNRSLLFVCETARVRVETTATPFTSTCALGEILTIPIKHGEGCYVADGETLRVLEEEARVVLRYVDESGRTAPEANPNGSLNNIAGITNEGRNVLGLMPHPEHAVEKVLGGEDGLRIFNAIIAHQAEGARPAPLSVAPGP
jgi:phosphoribosylformylglycinamidine synthase I